MEKSYEKESIEAEKTSAWFVRRKELVFSLLKKYPQSSKILDVGCGSGYMLDYLSKRGFKDVKGIENSRFFYRFNKHIKKTEKFIVEKNKYDIVLLLDVIEHLKSEKVLLSKIQKTLKPNGTLLISAPAYMQLWSHHDLLNKHYRRYTRKQLVSLLKSENFEIARATYWNSILLPAVYLSKKIEKILKLKKSNLELTPIWFNNVYKIILGIENAAIKIGINLPFGVSVFAIAKKLD